MTSGFTQLLVVGLGLSFGRNAITALRSGHITLYVRANRDRRFSRQDNPVVFWSVVTLYLLFGAVAVLGPTIGLFPQ